MSETQNLMTTLKGSLLENFFPKGWDLEKIDRCASILPEQATEPQSWWNHKFKPVPCGSVEEFDVLMGHEIAMAIRRAQEAGRQLIIILPVGPMGMYKWTVYFLKEWGLSARHVHGFNMDEWSDSEGKTLPASNPASFRYAMEDGFLRSVR